MFLEDRDYKVVCNDDTLDIITQSDEQTRRDAERSAQEEVEGYLRARYDTAKAFAQTGDKRNAMLVRVTVSIALFYLGQSLPQFMGNEQREIMYNTLSHGSKTYRAARPCPTCRYMNPRTARICRTPCGSAPCPPANTPIKNLSNTV